MNRVFVDMDGVLADFDRLKLELEVAGDDLKRMPGAFDRMQPIAGALAGVRSLIGMGYEVWIATKPPTGIPHAYADKAAWILRHLPELKRRIIMTHNKGLLGDYDDYLIDDRPHKAFCTDFKGRLIPFGNGIGWEWVVTKLGEWRRGAEKETQMPLFDCSKCGVIENTACTSGSWANLCSTPPKPMLCSECADGNWHGLFPRQMFAGSGYVKNGWRVQRPNPPGCICVFQHKSDPTCTYVRGDS